MKLRIRIITILASAILVIPALMYQPAYAGVVSPIKSNAGIEGKVKTLFEKSPEMIAIAHCESGFRQFNNQGKPLVGGGVNIGVFQISRGHTKSALALGMDIKTIEGNLAYAKHMFDNQGTRPWK